MQAASTTLFHPASQWRPGFLSLTNRKARSSKRQQGGGLLDLQNGALVRVVLCPTEGAVLGERTQTTPASWGPWIKTWTDLNHHLYRTQTLCCPAVLEGKQLRGPTNAQRKRAEKERRAKGKPPQRDQLKDVLADNDDSSSTTTETSNPDVEASNKEEPVKKKGRTAVTLEKEETKPQNNKRQTNPKDQSSSLELPYSTALENKQRKTFIHSALTTAPKIRTLHKPRPGSLSHLNSPDCSGLVPCGKLEDSCPFPVVKRLSNVSVSEPGHSSGSEGEKEFAATEWDLPLLTKTTNQADSLQQDLPTDHECRRLPERDPLS
nr:transmembrane protein 131-like [Salvelinus alpinus]